MNWGFSSTYVGIQLFFAFPLGLRLAGRLVHRPAAGAVHRRQPPRAPPCPRGARDLVIGESPRGAGPSRPSPQDPATGVEPSLDGQRPYFRPCLPRSTRPHRLPLPNMLNVLLARLFSKIIFMAACRSLLTYARAKANRDRPRRSWAYGRFVAFQMDEVAKNLFAWIPTDDRRPAALKFQGDWNCRARRPCERLVRRLGTMRWGF